MARKPLKKTRYISAKAEKFAKEYLIDLNATKAAIRAGYAPKNAHVTGCRLLTNAKVMEIIASKRALVEEKYNVTVDRIIREAEKIAFADIKHVVRWDENGLALNDFEQTDGRLISKISEGAKGNLKVELHDKLKALELLCNIQGYRDLRPDNQDSSGIARFAKAISPDSGMDKLYE